ncbi:MAG: ketol-acid reductoisomerase [Armatimonadota bacterium]
MPSTLSGKRICVVGYGSQGRAQALNLRDSGVDVVVGLRAGSAGVAEARADDVATQPIGEAVAGADVIALLAPDSAHEEIVRDVVNPRAKRGAALVFAHGYSITFGGVAPREDLQRLLVAPKAIGPELRRLYVEGSGAAALIAAEPGDIELARAYAVALGCGRAVILASSFREETETDLFGEQAVLCGGMPALVLASFETLVEAGYSPEAAWFECLFEVRLIAEMMIQHGVAGMVERISDTAKFGAMEAGEALVGEPTKAKLRELLQEIQSGRFAERYERERSGGSVRTRAWLQTLREARIQAAHEALAKTMGLPAAAAAAAEPSSGESATSGES